MSLPLYSVSVAVFLHCLFQVLFAVTIWQNQNIGIYLLVFSCFIVDRVFLAGGVWFDNCVGLVLLAWPFISCSVQPSPSNIKVVINDATEEIRRATVIAATRAR